ncbi:Metallo-dependent phosphatase [Sarocladium strictum]
MGLLAWVGLRRRNHWEPQTLLDHLLASPLTYLITIFYRIILLLRGRAFYPPRDKPAVKVVCISDTHDQTVPIPTGDILIHAGDLTNAGTVDDIQKQINWLAQQPHAVKIVIAGNHDSWFDPKSRQPEDVKSGRAVDLKDLIYLEGETTVQEVKGRKISIFGAPDIPKLGPSDFAFQYTDATQPWYSRVHPSTDILVTHTPPKSHLDLSLGCPHLLREVWRIKPRLHVFGHVHWGAGTEAVHFDDCQAAYERILARPQNGLIWDFFPSHKWIDVALVLVHGVHSVLWKWIMSGPGSNQGGLMVNAAQMYGNSGKVKSRAVVVDI